MNPALWPGLRGRGHPRGLCGQLSPFISTPSTPDDVQDSPGQQLLSWGGAAWASVHSLPWDSRSLTSCRPLLVSPCPRTSLKQPPSAASTLLRLSFSLLCSSLWHLPATGQLYILLVFGLLPGPPIPTLGCQLCKIGMFVRPFHYYTLPSQHCLVQCLEYNGIH